MLKPNKLTTAGQGLQVLEAYAAAPGLMQQTPAIYKVVFTFCYLLTVVSVSRYNWPGLLPFVAYPLLAVNLIGLPWRLFFKRLLVVLPFVALLGGVNIFLDDRTVYFAAGFSMSGGWASFITLALKAVLTVGAVLLLMSSTSLNAVAGALTHLRVPCILVMQLLMTWRYAGVLALEAGNMLAAYQLRGGGGKGINIRHWPQFTGLFLLRAMTRAQALSRAMNCRLLDMRRIEYTKPVCQLQPVMFWLVACCVCVAIRVWF